MWLLGGSGGISPLGENFELRYSQIAIWDKLSKQHILATIIINFKISGGGIPGAPTPLYETLIRVHTVHTYRDRDKIHVAL